MAAGKSSAGWWALPYALTVALVLAIGSALAMSLMGWPLVHDPKPVEEPPAPPVAVVSQWQESPASVKLQEALDKAPKGWEGNGQILTSPQTPYPFSCSNDGLSPAVSYAKNFKASGTHIQVLVSAYTAGLGQVGLQQKIDRSYSCAGGDASYGLYPLGDFTEAYQANVSKTGQNTKTYIIRYGDVVTYVIADANNSNAYNLSVAFQEHLESVLGEVCQNPDYEKSPVERNPFSGSEYKGYFATDKVNIKEVKKPELPKDAPYEDVAFDAEPSGLKDVEVPVKPTEYPVWPELPSEVKKPEAPNAPAKNAPIEKSVKVKAEDTKGPGCGWDFTGSTVPQFDAETAEGWNDEQRSKATASLNDEAKKWQESVLKYWESFAKYEEQAPKWNAYVDDVNEVREAWAVIDTQWQEYYTDKANYDAAVAARDDFLSRQKAAQASYDKLVEQCKVQAEEDAQKAEEEAQKEAEAEENAETNPTNEPTAPADEENSESEEEENRVDCPAERPVILDQEAPEVGDAPDQPADPRPESEQ